MANAASAVLETRRARACGIEAKWAASASTALFEKNKKKNERKENKSILVRYPKIQIESVKSKIVVYICKISKLMIFFFFLRKLIFFLFFFILVDPNLFYSHILQLSFSFFFLFLFISQTDSGVSLSSHLTYSVVLDLYTHNFNFFFLFPFSSRSLRRALRPLSAAPYVRVLNKNDVRYRRWLAVSFSTIIEYLYSYIFVFSIIFFIILSIASRGLFHG